MIFIIGNNHQKTDNVDIELAISRLWRTGTHLRLSNRTWQSKLWGSWTKLFQDTW